MISHHDNIFMIPFGSGQFIVYLPLHGILFKANTAAINLFNNALKGDAVAAAKFGLSQEQINVILGREKDFPPVKDRTVVFKPTILSLFLTTACSMKCIYCYADAGNSIMKIRLEYIEIATDEVIRNALGAGSSNIVINYHGGGDIGAAWKLMTDSKAMIGKRAAGVGINPIFSTGLNGVLSDSQRTWIVNNTHSSTVSIDGYAGIQNIQRPLKNGTPSFNFVHRTLKYFDERDFNYAIRTTVTAESVRHLEEIVSFFCNNYNAKKIKIEPVSVQGRAVSNKICPPAPGDFVNYFLKAKAVAMANKRELLYSGARFDVLTDIFCLAAGQSFGVTPDGYITSCYEVLTKDNPLSEIFFYGKIEKGRIVVFQDKLNYLSKLNVNEKEKCRRCFAKFHCAGDCPAKAILSEKDGIDSDYRCIINRELTKDQLMSSIV
jgi:uncharacterized protein